MWTVKVFTLYPELFPGPLASGLYKKALEKKIWSLKTINIRDSANDKHKTVDDTPFGGGSGMVIRPDVLANSLDKNITDKKEPIIYLTPKGKKFDQKYSKKIAKKNINIICGHFEGIDERIIQTRNIEEVSIGDFILSGGEIAAFIIINSVVRLLPGVLGNTDSLYEESFENSLLEYPQYTKPQKWEKKEVPSVLLSGNHKKIKDWRLAQSEDITRRRRPDLWEKYKKKNEKH
jgi:tRNA (guanine37-N1)-methyltransferase